MRYWAFLVFFIVAVAKSTYSRYILVELQGKEYARSDQFVTKEVRCADNQFECGNGRQCLASRNVCCNGDFHKAFVCNKVLEPRERDCDDKSDELNCDCKTIGGNFPNRPCVFPFTFKGKTYHECTEMVTDNHGYSLPQCPTKKEFVVNSTIYHWGNCGSECPGSPDKVLNTECKTKTWGSPCKFPFVKYGVTYRGCTRDGILSDNWDPWCGIKFTTCLGWISKFTKCNTVKYPDGTNSTETACYRPKSMEDTIDSGVCANWDYCQDSEECKETCRCANTEKHSTCQLDWKPGMHCQVRRPTNCPDLACDAYSCDHPDARLYSKEACKKAHEG